MNKQELKALRAKMKKSPFKNTYFAEVCEVSTITLSHAIHGRRTGDMYDEIINKIEKLVK